MWWKVRFQSPNSSGYGPRRTNGMNTKLTKNTEINKNALFCAFILLCVISSESGVNATFFRWLFSRPYDSTRHTGRSLHNYNGEPLERMSFLNRNQETSPNPNFYSNPLPQAEPEPTQDEFLPDISPTERSRSMSIFSYLIRRLTRNRNFDDNRNQFLPSSSPFVQHQYPSRTSFAWGRKSTTSTESTYNSNTSTKSEYDSNSKQITVNKSEATLNPETNITRSTKSYFSNEEQNIIASTATAHKEDITHTNYLTDYKVDSADLPTFSLVEHHGENDNFENETHTDMSNDTMVEPSKISMNLLLPKTTEMSADEAGTETSSNVLPNNMTSASIFDEYSAFENGQDVLDSAGWNSSSDNISSALQIETITTPASTTTLSPIFEDNTTTATTDDFMVSKEESTATSSNNTTASETPVVALSPHHETPTDNDDYEVHDTEVEVTAKTTTKIPSGPVPVYDSDFSDSTLNEDIIKVNPEETYIQPIHAPNFKHDPNHTKTNDSLPFSSVSISIQVQNLSKPSHSNTTKNELHGDSNGTDQALEDIERTFLYKATAPPATVVTGLTPMIPLLRPQPRLVNDDPDRKEKDNQLHFPEDLTTLHKLLQHLVETIGSVIPPRSKLSDRNEQVENGPIKPSFYNINIGTINLNTGQNSRIINNGYPPSLPDPTDSNNGGNRNENNMELQHRPEDRHEADGNSNQGGTGMDWLHSKSTSASSSPRISYSLPPKNNSHGQFSVLILT